MKYIALLRSINIGKRNVSMEKLRELFTNMGVTDVRSYIQTGNIFFESVEGDRDILTNDIEKMLREKLGYDVSVFLRTPEELQQIVDSNPFNAINPDDNLRFCVVFLKNLPENIRLPLQSSKQDWEVIALGQKEAFVIWRIIDGRPPSNFSEFNKIFGENTSRFFHTTKKILEAEQKST